LQRIVPLNLEHQPPGHSPSMASSGWLQMNSSPSDLWEAARTANLELLVSLLDEKKYDIHPTPVNTDFLCGSLLHVAAECGESTAMVAELIRRGLPLEAKDKEGRTVLLRAAKGGNLDMVKYLLDQQGAYLYAYDRHNYSALHLAAQYGKNPALVTELIHRGLGVEERAWKGRTPLLCAIEGNDTTIALLLLNEHRANLFVETDGGLTALHICVAFSKNFILASELLHRGLTASGPIRLL
jgi:ankyrin repeat protein